MVPFRTLHIILGTGCACGPREIIIKVRITMNATNSRMIAKVIPEFFKNFFWSMLSLYALEDGLSAELLHVLYSILHDGV